MRKLFLMTGAFGLLALPAMAADLAPDLQSSGDRPASGAGSTSASTRAAPGATTIR